MYKKQHRKSCIPCLLGMKSDQTPGTFGCFPGSTLGAGRHQVSAWMRFPSTHLWGAAECSQFSEIGAGADSHLVP